MNPLLAEISERDFAQQIVDLATLEKWLVYRTHDSRKSPAGFPDLVIVRGTRLGFLELKSERGRIRPEQQQWIDALHQVTTVGAHIVRPSNFGAIQAALRTR